MKKEKQDTGRESCDKEVLQALRNLEFEVRSLKCRQDLCCMDLALPLLLIGLLGFNSSASRWNKEEVEEFCREQKEKEKENI